MSAPLMFITTGTIDEGKLEEYMDQNSAFGEFLEAGLSSLTDFQIYLNREQTEATFVFVFRDAIAAEAQMRIARERIRRGLEIELEGDGQAALKAASAALAQQARGLRRARAAARRYPVGSPLEGHPESPWRDLHRRPFTGSRR